MNETAGNDDGSSDLKKIFHVMCPKKIPFPDT